MASIGEVGSTTPITSPAEPATHPDLIAPEAPSAIPVETPPIVVKPAAPRNKALVWVGGALRRIWMSRGLFGGLTAMYLAFTAQKALIDQGDWVTAQRYYLAAFIILILSLMHPTFSFFRRKPRPKAVPVTTPVIVETAETTGLAGDSIETTVVLEPHLNGSTTNGDHALVTNGNLVEAHENGNGHTEAETLSDLEIIAPLPTRRAGSRVALATSDLPVTAPVIAEAVAAPVITEPEVVAAPIAPRVSRAPKPKVRHQTRPLDESEVPARAVVASGKRSLKTAYFDLRASLGWKATVPLFLITVGLAGWIYFLLERDIASVLTGWMWFGTMLLLVATFYGAPRWPRAVQGLLDGPDEGFFARGVPRIPVKLETALVILMLVGALAIRLYNLEYLPGIFGDEGERGLDARGILHGNTDPIFGAGWWVVPNVYFYTLSWSLRIFGDNLIGDRMLSVICGMLVIFLIYKIGRLLWGARVGLIAGSLLAISPIWIMFSRHASESTPTVTCWVIGFYFLFRALRFRQWVDWVLAGMGFGFSLYFYASGKLVVPLLAALGVYMFVRWRWEFMKRYAVGYALLLGTFLLTFMPHLVWLKADNFFGFFVRAREVSIFTDGHPAMIFANHGIPYDPNLANLSVVDTLLAAPWPWAQVIWNQFRISFDVLYRVSGGSTFFYQLNDHNGTLLTPVIAALCLLGIVYGTWKLWDARYGIALVWFVVGLAAVAFTLDTPHVQRIVGSWPVLMLFPAVMIDRVLASAWPLNIKFARQWLTIPVIGLFIFASYEAIREYFVVYEAGCSICNSTVQARYVATFGNDYKGYMFGVGGYPVYFDYGSTRFTVPDAPGEDLNIPMDFFPITTNKGRGLAFMFYPANLQYKSVVSMFYPDGIAQDMKGNNDSFVFASYKVPPAQVAAMQSTFAEYTDVRGATVHRNEPNLGTTRPSGVNPWAPPPQLIFPITATWQGGLVAPDYGQYTFQLSGGSNAVFEIDGEVLLDGADPAKQQATVVLARGSHEVHISGTIADANSRIELGWAGGSSAPVPISSNFLYNGVLGGLTATVGNDSSAPIDAADPFANQVPVRYQIHPFLSVRDAGGGTASFGGRPTFIRWQGTILAPVSGSYAFTIQSNGANLMMIDGQTIISSQGGVNAPNPIMLTAGEHTVDIRYAWQGQFGGTFEWYWTPPGGENTIVPPSVLTPVKRMWKPGEVTAPASTPNVAPPPPPSVSVKADAILGADVGLKEAVGLGADAQGNVYISDNGNNRIVKLDSSGRTVATWGSATDQSAEGKFGILSDVYASPDGHLYTLDTKTGDIHIFNPDGTVARYLPGLARSSLGITAGSNGNIYIGNTQGSAVLVFSPDGNILNKFEGGPGGTLQHFEQPMDVAVGPDGTVYEIDMRGRVAQLDGSGNIVREWPMQWGIARGGSHLVYWKGKLVMTDPDRQRLLVIDLSTNNMGFVGQEGGSDSQMRVPVGIAVGADDKLYVMDSGNNRVLVFNDLDP